MTRDPEIPPKRIQRKRVKGWRMPEGAVYVGRGTSFGNPYRHEHFGGNREAVVAAYWRYLHHQNGADVLNAVKRKLRGKDLACWCPLSQPCHADVLLEIANAK